MSKQNSANNSLKHSFLITQQGNHRPRLSIL